MSLLQHDTSDMMKKLMALKKKEICERLIAKLNVSEKESETEENILQPSPTQVLHKSIFENSNVEYDTEGLNFNFGSSVNLVNTSQEIPIVQDEVPAEKSPHANMEDISTNINDARKMGNE